MIFYFLRDERVRSFTAIAIGISLTAFLWCIEKTKQIPQYALMFYEMGVSCQNSCGQDEQLKYFQRAVRYASRFMDAPYNARLSDAYYQCALIYEKKGDYANTARSFIKAIDTNPTNLMAYYRLGIYYYKGGYYELALRYLLRAFHLPGYPDDIYYYLARIYDQRQDYKLAVQHYDNIISLHPEYVDEVYPRLAEIYYFLNDEDFITHRLLRLRELKRNDLANRLEKEYNALQASGISREAVGRQ